MITVFTAYTPIDKCVGREIEVHSGGETYRGMLAGIYSFGEQTILVVTPMTEPGVEWHIPLGGAVVRLQAE